MAKKKKNIGKSAGILIIILFIGSTLAIGLRSLGDDTPEVIEGKEVIEFKGYTFYFDSIENTYSIFAKIENNQIIYNIDLREATTRLVFREDPRNMSNIPLDDGVLDKIFSSDKLYLAYNPNSENISKIVVAAIEIARLTGNIYNLPTIEAYTEDADPIDPDIPLRTCNDSTDSATVMVFQITNTTEIILDNKCVFVRGKNADELIESADKLGMNLVGVNI